jgi:hypothetical protein
MLSTLSHWLILFFISYPLGVATMLIMLPSTHFKADSHKFAVEYGGLFCVLHSFIGLVVVSSVANIASIFYQLKSELAFVIAGISILLWFLNVGNCRDLFFEIVKRLRFHFSTLLLLIFSVAIYAIKSVSFPEIFDDGAYALPLVKMYEVFHGPIYGFANLNAHNGLNSSWHSLHAVVSRLSYSGIFFQETYVLNSYFAFLWLALSVTMLQKGINEKRADPIIFIPGILLLTIFRNQLTSLSTDIPVIIGCWLVLYLLLLMSEMPHHSNYLVAGVWLLPFWLVSIKLTAAALMVLPIYFILIHEDAFSKFRKMIWLFAGLVVISPWLIQNYIISGYLLFPLKFTGFIPAQWQVPQVAIDEKMYSAQFGIYALPQNPSFQWFFQWWQAHPVVIKILLILAFYITIIRMVFFMPKSRKYYLQPGFAAIITAVLGWGIWFFTISEPRYGFGFFPFLAALALAGVFRAVSQFIGLYVITLCFVTIQVVNLSKSLDEAGGWDKTLLAKQRSVPSLITRSIQCGNFTAVTPVSYTNNEIDKPPFCWDCALPCLPKEEIGDSAWVFQFEMAGKPGFYSKQF